MKRNPSMHIAYSDLVDILGRLGMDDPKSFAVELMKAAVPHSIKNRYIVQGDAEARKKARRIIAASATEGISPEKFNRLLTSARVQRQHMGAKPVKAANITEWTLLKEVAQLASEFAADFGLDLHEGVRIFIELGLQHMARGTQYSLGKFKYYDERIRKLYQALDIVENDPDKATTSRIYERWRELMHHYGGFSRPVKRHEEFVYFVYVGIEIKAAGATVDDWLTAQFEGMGAMDKIPEFYNLIGEWALKCYYTYMNKVTKNKKKRQEASYDRGRSEFDKKYFDSIRNKAATEID